MSLSFSASAGIVAMYWVVFFQTWHPLCDTLESACQTTTRGENGFLLHKKRQRSDDTHQEKEQKER